MIPVQILLDDRETWIFVQNISHHIEDLGCTILVILYPQIGCAKAPVAITGYITSKSH